MLKAPLARATPQQPQRPFSNRWPLLWGKRRASGPVQRVDTIPVAPLAHSLSPTSPPFPIPAASNSPLRPPVGSTALAPLSTPPQLARACTPSDGAYSSPPAFHALPPPIPVGTPMPSLPPYRPLLLLSHCRFILCTLKIGESLNYSHFHMNC